MNKAETPKESMNIGSIKIDWTDCDTVRIQNKYGHFGFIHGGDFEYMLQGIINTFTLGVAFVEDAK